MKKLVTLKDIARETGLTMASVSRALRDMPDIADETKQYVHDVAENLGYHPNVFAASLRTGKSKFIGLIIPQNTNPYFATVMADVIAVVIENGYIPLVLNSLDSLDRDDLVRILTEPKNAMTKQYKALMRYDGVELEFEPDALGAIADKAIEMKIGARGLRSVMEKTMTDIMYTVPSDTTIEKVVVTADCVRGGTEPLVIHGQPSDAIVS